MGLGRYIVFGPWTLRAGCLLQHDCARSLRVLQGVSKTLDVWASSLIWRRIAP